MRLLYYKGKQESFCQQLQEKNATWLAALIDGEGCISISYQTPYHKPIRAYPHLTISNGSRKLIEKCFQLTRIGGINAHKPQKGNIPIYNWNTTGSRVSSVLIQVYPYLIVKKEQAKVALYLDKINNFDKSKNTDKIKFHLWQLMGDLNQYKISKTNLPNPEKATLKRKSRRLKPNLYIEET